MNREKREYYLFFWLAAGMAFATVAANRLFAAGIVSYEALYRSVAEGWSVGRPGRVLLIRIAQTTAIFWLCRSRRAGMGLSFLLFTAGFIGATALVMFTWNRGWFGLVCFLLSGFSAGGFLSGGLGADDSSLRLRGSSASRQILECSAGTFSGWSFSGAPAEPSGRSAFMRFCSCLTPLFFWESGKIGFDFHGK